MREARPDSWARPQPGSGRSIIRQVFRADTEVNEITAHARAAVSLHPKVDTIIEIGGQDSKFTRVRDGDVYFSTMNYVCAAGTGSFIEEQAKRLAASLSEFSDMALSERAPFTSDRCTVYMERDLAALVGEGWPRESLAAAVLHSVRDNYLSKVVGKSALGETIVFQGATARNKALVAAFEQHLGKTLHVSPWCHLTGAVGAALLCREQGTTSSSFLWETGPIIMESEECALCSNHCRLTVVERSGKRTAWGMKCGREYEDRKPRGRYTPADETSGIEQRFGDAMPLSSRAACRAFRTRLPQKGNQDRHSPLPVQRLLRAAVARLPLPPGIHGGDIGAAQGRPGRRRESVNSDFCAPMVISHGYVRQLLEKGVDFVFLPAVENSQGKLAARSPQRFAGAHSDSADRFYSQYLPSVIGNLTAFPVAGRLIAPLLPLREKSDEEIAGALLDNALAEKVPNLEPEETLVAYAAAKTRFDNSRARLVGTFQRAERVTTARVPSGKAPHHSPGQAVRCVR